jgi:hypothetical protein
MRRRALALLGLTAVLITSHLSPPSHSALPYSFAVTGDIPYGSTSLSRFPGRIDQINADSSVQFVVHVGDISSPLNCSTTYYRTIKSHFDRFRRPLVYTPGDNEWADCHRASGAPNPLNRLSAVRSVFYPVTGRTLGQSPASVTAQSGYVENVRFSRESVTFVTVHLVGSYNDLAPWTGLGYSSPTTQQRSEMTARTNAAVGHLRAAFSSARAGNHRAVVIFTQADMFESTSGTARTAFRPFVQALASESQAWRKPVFLINGDSHVYETNRPLTQSSWLSFYRISGSVPNLTRYTIEGGSSLDEWLKLTIGTSTAVVTAQRVRFS